MSPPRYIFRRKTRWYSSPLYIFCLSTLVLSGLLVTQGMRRGEIKPLFLPTPTPTRIADSYILEAETHFQAGSLDAAIASYQDAIQVNPQNGRLYAELARILTYSTESQTTEKEKLTRFQLALDDSLKATQLAPDDSTAFAVRAFTLDWYASFVGSIQRDQAKSTGLLAQAAQAVTKAITLDETNQLAQIYRAEIMIDQQNYSQADEILKLVLPRAETQWEVHRVNGLYMESQGYYQEAIDEFKRAAELAPKMTFLYIKLGQSYRGLGLKTNNANSEIFFNQALDYFARAVALNDQLGIQDSLPYLGLARTYAQLGQSLASSINMNKALRYNPSDPAVYAELGMIYRQARNYEDAITALRCAVRGCKADDTCTLRKCDPDVDAPVEFSTGMGLSGQTVVYYYTYASLLAGMYLPRDPKRATYCADSSDVIQEIRGSTYGSDQTIGAILSESEAICRSMLSAGALPPPATATQPGGTPSAPTRSPTPTRPPTRTLTPVPTPKSSSGG